MQIALSPFTTLLKQANREVGFAAVLHAPPSLTPVPALWRRLPPHRPRLPCGGATLPTSLRTDVGARPRPSDARPPARCVAALTRAKTPPAWHPSGRHPGVSLPIRARASVPLRVAPVRPPPRRSSDRRPRTPEVAA